MAWLGCPALQGQCPGTAAPVPLHPQEPAAGSLWGIRCNWAGADTSPRGGDIAPQSMCPARVPSSQRKSWDEEDRHPGASCGLPSPAPPLLRRGTCPRMMGVHPTLPPSLHRSTHPPPRLPSRLFGKGSAWKGTNPKGTIIFPATNGSAIQRGSRIFKAGMLSSRVGNISATPSPPFPTGFITLQLLSFIPLSLPGCSYAAQRARCREGFPAPDVQRYLGE